MIDTSLIKDWDKAHFMAYICLCVAASDNSIDDSELEETKNKVHEFLGEDIDYDRLMNEVMLELKNHSLQDKKDVINMKRNKFFTTKEERFRVIDTVEDVIVADLNIEQSELEIYKILKNAFDIDDLIN